MMERTVTQEESFKKGLFSGTFKDGIFFFFIVGVPSNFFGMIDPSWLYKEGFFDVRMPVIVFCALLSAVMFWRMKLLSLIPARQWILLTAGYVSAQFILSAVEFGAYNAFKVFRYYCLPLVGVGPILYIAKLSQERQERLIRWILIATMIQGALFILHHAGISVFFSESGGIKELASGSVQRYYDAFPLFTVFVLNASLAFILFKNRLNLLGCFLLMAAVVMLYATRGVILQSVFSIILMFFMAMVKQVGNTVKRLVIIIAISTLGVLAFTILFPQYPGFVAERFFEIDGADGLRNAPNYLLRILFVESVLLEMSSFKETLFGYGYECRFTSDWGLGEATTAITMQGDAPIAGLLYAEGFVGVLMRALPFAVLFLMHVRFFVSSKNAQDTMLSGVIVIMIMGTGLTWLQTTALCDTPISLLPYLLMHFLHSRSRTISIVNAAFSR